MFKTRLLSGIVLVIAALALIITGGDVLLISTLVISYIGMFELYRIFHIEKEAVGIIGYLAATVYYCNLKFAFLPDTMVFVLGVLILMMFAYVFTYPKYKTEQVLAAFFGVFYVAVMLSYVYQTRMIEAGAYIVWLVFLCSWGCDTCAYCVGMLIGKHKMSPKLSPKKSVEGAVGGVVGAALLTIIYGMIFKSAMQIDQTHVWIMAGISAVGALISMVGDLTASAIKRNYEIKDYGKLIPGHGGILDRFDSVIFTAPVIYYLAKMIYAGEDPKFIARRVVICAAEDVGNADPHALQVAVSAMQAVNFIGMPEGRIPLAQAVTYVSCAPKSNAAYLGIDKALADVRNVQIKGVPPHLRDGHYSGSHDLGNAIGYKYAHDYPNHYVEQQYLPDELVGTVYYDMSNNGVERRMKEHMKRLKGEL